MNASHYRLPAGLMQLIAYRLRSNSSPEEIGLQTSWANLSNAEIAEVLESLMQGGTVEGLTTQESRPPSLTAEEQAIKEQLLREIRMQTTKLTLKSPPPLIGILAQTG